jgi:hypothetical protein
MGSRKKHAQIAKLVEFTLKKQSFPNFFVVQGYFDEHSLKNSEISGKKNTGTWEFEPKVGRRVVACLAMSCHPEASPRLVVRSAPLPKTFSVLCVVASIALSLFLSLSLVIVIIKRRRISMFTVSDEVVTLFFSFFCSHAHQLHRSWRAVVVAAGIGARRRKRRRGRRTGDESGDGATSLRLHEIDAMSSADF